MLPRAVRDLTSELTRLPGIGPKTAQRLSIFILRQPRSAIARLADTLKNLHANVRTCSTCFNLAEAEQCDICRDQMRTSKVLCVVEDPLDAEAIERTSSFSGRYHILGGVLSPIEGISAEQLTLRELFARIEQEKTEELIVALDHTMESEATTRHIIHALQGRSIKITRLARGLPTGGDIEFADALTLSAAMAGRKELS